MEFTFWSILAQLLNFGILMFLYMKFLAKPISKAIEERRALIKKIENADKAYDEKIKEAEEKSDVLLKEWLAKKEQLLLEAGILANKRKEEILQEAKSKASEIMEDSKQKAQYLENELKSNFENWIKRASILVVKKLFNNQKDLQKEYLDNIVKEVVNEK